MPSKTKTAKLTPRPWPEECPIGRGVTGISNKRMDEPQMMVVGICDWRKDQPTKTTYAEAETLTAEIRRRWKAAPGKPGPEQL